MDQDEKNYVSKSKQQQELGKQVEQVEADALKELKLDPKEYTITLTPEGDVLLTQNPEPAEKK